MPNDLSILKKNFWQNTRQTKFLLRIFISREDRWKFWYKDIKPRLVKRNILSEMPIDVMIPATEKDSEILPYTIDGVRKNVKHPISKIIIVSPASEKIQELCAEKRCVFVNERSVLDIDSESLGLIIKGVDRSKWIYQQFLKWSGDRLTSKTHYLVVDADTVFIRPQSFEHKGNVIFNFSDEYHQPYFEIYKRILKETVKCPVSFTSHHMLFEINKLIELKKRMEEINNCIWYAAILKNLDRNEISGHSDYETYGQYVYSHYNSKVALEYWFNLSLKRNDLDDLEKLELAYGKKYKSMSFHSWNR